MSASEADSDAAAFCAEQVRTLDFPRYASTLFIAADTRRALLALYAFNLEIARVHEQVSQPLPGEIRLQWWTDMLEGIEHGAVESHPVAAELMRAVAAYALPREPLLRLIEAHHFDLYNDPMPDRPALEAYAADTVSVVFSLAARIAGGASDEIEHLAVHAGVAQGLVRIVANIGRDISQRRAFVPQDVLQQHGSSLDELFAGAETPALRAARDDVLKIALEHLDTALTMLGDAPSAVRPVFLPLALVKHDRAQLAETPVFAPHEPPSRLRVLWTLWWASKSKAFS